MRVDVVPPHGDVGGGGGRNPADAVDLAVVARHQGQAVRRGQGLTKREQQCLKFWHAMYYVGLGRAVLKNQSNCPLKIRPKVRKIQLLSNTFGLVTISDR